MCLGVPGQVVMIRAGVATLDVWGARVDVRLDVLKEPVKVSDYVVELAGYAIRRIAPELVAETLAMYEIVLSEACQDPIARDVVAELA